MRKRPLLLVVDDNRNIREFCKRELEREGYDVRLGGNGYEAIESVQRESPDLVVLDILLPLMDGFEIADRIGALDARIPVVFYTAHIEYRADRRADAARALVPKTEDLADLKATVKHLLAERPQISTVQKQ